MLKQLVQKLNKEKTPLNIYFGCAERIYVQGKKRLKRLPLLMNAVPYQNNK
jgi:hypothetical protein